ncbi:MAG: hypothetical protein HGB12_14880 [Bacteroidetes bacterium]|nr:hypothetical protein [Bacteroidota bacterium]
MEKIPVTIWIEINDKDDIVDGIINLDSENLTCYNVAVSYNSIQYILKTEYDKKVKELEERIKHLRNCLKTKSKKS